MQQLLSKSVTRLFLSLLLVGIGVASAQKGKVFRDYNANGTKETTEPLIAGVTVNAYNTANTVCGTAVSSATADGSGNNYTITGCSGDVRVEFIIPAATAAICGLSNELDYTGHGGSSYGSSVQFTTSSGTANFAVANPNQYTSPTLTNPKVFTSCYVSGNNLGGGNVGAADAFVGVDYNPTGNTTPAPAHYANTAQIGSTWGIAYSKQAKKVFTSAVLKRHTGLGPLGSGGIYMIDPTIQLPSTTGVTQFLDFDAIGIPTRGTGTYAGSSVAGTSVTFSPVIGTNTERGLGTNTNSGERDAQALAQAGRVSFGDMDLSDDGRYLYIMNLYDRKLYEIDLTDAYNPVAPTIANKATKIRSWAIPNPCIASEGVARPWGIDFYRGKPYIGVVCNAEVSGLKTDLDFTIYELDPTSGTFTSQFTSTLGFLRGIANAFVPNGATRTGWFGWTDDWATLIQGTGAVTWPQPILSDLEFDTDGSIIMGFIDRSGLQGGWNNLSPTTGNNTLYMTMVGGDLLRAYKRPDCDWELESAGKEGPNSPKAATGGATNNEGPGGGEFYYEESFGGMHNETALGGVGISFGTGDVVSTVYDPFRFDSFGVGWFDNTTGKKDKGFEIFFTGNSGSTPTSGTFSKGLSLGDVEIENEIPAIEIGNRIWNDADFDGIQDAGEAGINGVSIELYEGTLATGSPVQTTTSATNGGQTGTWYFANLKPNTDYVVKVATALGSGSLATYVAYTSKNAGTTTTDNNTTDGLISLKTGDAGQNNHTYDIGVTEAPPCTMPDAGADVTICLPKTTLDLTDAAAGTTWSVGSGNPATATINATTGKITGLTVAGTYKFVLTNTSDAACKDEMQVIVTEGDTPILLCDDGSTSYTLTAQAGLTNVVWYNMAGQQVGTGNTLVVSSNTNGLSDGSEAFYYEASDASLCPVEACCPVKFITESCCPVPNCLSVTVIKN